MSQQKPQSVPVDVPRVITGLMKRLRLNYREMSELTGVPKSTLWKWRSGALEPEVSEWAAFLVAARKGRRR